MVLFEAHAVYSGMLEDVLLVVLAAEKDGGGAHVTIQRGVSFDEHTYCITTHDGATHYGGIVAWSVESGFVTLQLSPKASRTLKVSGGFEIRIPRESTDAVREWLAKIIDGKEK